jgi:hypothetical protein
MPIKSSGHIRWQQDTQRNFMDGLGNQLGFKLMEDWYSLITTDITNNGGRSLLKKYSGSPSALVKSVYSGYEWKEGHFGPNRGFWNNPTNQRKYLDDLGKKLGFVGKDDWYNITLKHVLENGGSALLRIYGNSPANFVKSVYLEHPWDDSKFNTKQGKYKLFLDRLGHQLEFKQMEDWYLITKEQILENGGAGILSKHNNSPSEMVMSVYNQHQWELSKFLFKKGNSDDHCDTSENRILMIKYLAKQLHIIDLEDWYRVSLAQINQFQKHMPVFGTHSLERLLVETYPEHCWHLTKFQFKAEKAAQRWLKVIVGRLFPHSGRYFESVNNFRIELHENYRHERLRFARTESPMELDIFLPSERLAFEYHGEQHYHDIKVFGNHWDRMQRDKEKRSACSEEGITLIEVPYWWDKSIASLAATIQQQRSGLIDHKLNLSGEAIPLKSPENSSSDEAKLMHGEEWDGVQDLDGW